MTQIFVSIRSTLRILGLSIGQSFENMKHLEFKRTILFVVVFMFTIFGVMCVVEANTFTQYSKSIYGLVSNILTLINLATLFWNIPNIIELIDDFQNTIRIRQENSASKAIYEETNKRIEKWTSAMSFVLTELSVYFVMGINFAMNMIAYSTTGLGDYDYNFPFPIWSSFKQNLLEYFVEFIIESVYANFFTTTLVGLYALLTGSCLMIMAFVEDLKSDITNLKAMDLSKENLEEVRQKIFAFIRFHSHIKQCVSKVSRIYAPIFPTWFIYLFCMNCISLLTFQIETSKETPDYEMLVIAFVQLFDGITFCFLPCELGEQLSSRFEELYDEICQFDTYLLPIEMQRTLQIIIMAAQEPVQLVGFGNVVCSRNTFKQVLNAS